MLRRPNVCWWRCRDDRFEGNVLTEGGLLRQDYEASRYRGASRSSSDPVLWWRCDFAAAHPTALLWGTKLQGERRLNDGRALSHLGRQARGPKATVAQAPVAAVHSCSGAGELWGHVLRSCKSTFLVGDPSDAPPMLVLPSAHATFIMSWGSPTVPSRSERHSWTCDSTTHRPAAAVEYVDADDEP